MDNSSYRTPDEVVRLMAGWAGKSTQNERESAAQPPREFLKVSEARQRYLSGKMSLRWWYNQIDAGRLPHYRIAGAVLLTPEDIEKFIENGFQPPRVEEPGETTAPVPDTPKPNLPVPKARTKKGSPQGGLRFFH